MHQSWENGAESVHVVTVGVPTVAGMSTCASHYDLCSSEWLSLSGVFTVLSLSPWLVDFNDPRSAWSRGPRAIFMPCQVTPWVSETLSTLPQSLSAPSLSDTW